jgi:hypothetical protein
MAVEKEIILRVEVDRTESQKELESVTKQLLENKQAAKELGDAYKQGKVSTEQYVRETIGLKKSQKELVDQQKVLTKELAVESNSLEALRLKLAALTKERNQTNQSTKEGSDRAAELTKEISGLNEAISAQEQAGGDFRRNVGNYGTAFKEAVGGVQIFGQSLTGLFKTLLANPFTAIAAALYGLFQALKQNDTIATAFKGVMTGLGVVFDTVSSFISNGVLALVSFADSTADASATIKDIFIRALNAAIAPINFLIDIMPALGEALSGNFAKAADLAGEATVKFGNSIAGLNNEVPEFIQNIGDAIDVGIRYEKTLDDIEAKQSKLNVTIAEYEKQRDKLLIQSKDLSKTESERIRLNEQAEAVNKKILAERLALLDQEIAAQREYAAALGEGSVKQEQAQFRLNDLLVERINFEKEALKFDELALNKRNALLEKQRAEAEKAAEAEKKRKEKEAEDQKKLIERSMSAELKLQEFRIAQAAKNAEDINARLEKELELEDFRIETALNNENLLASERLFIIEQAEAKKVELTKAAEEQVRSEQEKTAKLNRQLQQSRLGQAQNVADTLAGLAEQGSQTQKILASAAAFINTAQGVTGALANSAPPPVGLGPVGSLIAAGTIGAAGLAQIAKINAAAGGGDFVTNKPTLLLVGDNPGGRERVTVEPLSGKGKTKVYPGSGLVAMAGGGTLTTGASLTKGMSGPINSDVSQTNTIITAFKNLPAPEVSVKEVTKRSDRVRVKETIKNL